MTYTEEQLSRLPVFARQKVVPTIGINGRFFVVDTLNAGDHWVQYDASQRLYRCAPKGFDWSAVPFGPWQLLA